MEINNIKKVTFWFENVMGFTVKSDVIKSFEINEYQFHIGTDIAYRTKIVLDNNARAEFSNPMFDDAPWNVEINGEKIQSPIKRLNKYDDITRIEIEYNDGSIAKVKPYWGDFSQDEYSIFQKSYYEVNEKDELTGNFIVEFYTDCFTENFAKLPNVYELQKIIDDNFYKYNPLGLDDSDKHVYHDYGLYESARWLFNLGKKAYNPQTFVNGIYPAIAKQFNPEKHRKLIENVIDIIYNEWTNRKVSLDE